MSVNKLVCDWPGSSYSVLPAASATLSFKPVMSLNIECSLSISSLLCGNTFICSVFFVFWPKRNHYLVYRDNFLEFMIKSCSVKQLPLLLSNSSRRACQIILILKSIKKHLFSGYRTPPALSPILCSHWLALSPMLCVVMLQVTVICTP